MKTRGRRRGKTHLAVSRQHGEGLFRDLQKIVGVTHAGALAGFGLSHSERALCQRARNPLLYGQAPDPFLFSFAGLSRTRAPAGLAIRDSRGGVRIVGHG